MKFFNLSLSLALTASASLLHASLAAFGTTSSSSISTGAGQRGAFLARRPPTKSWMSTETDTDADAPTLTIPPTTTSAESEVNNNSGDDELLKEKLPMGVMLTGGKKLREEGLTGKGVKIAVIDSGVDADHPEFGDQVTQQIWYRRGSPLTEDFHGTHVAGTIHMMAPEAEIFDYRVFGRFGFSSVNRAVVRAIRSAVEDGCDIINMSLGSAFQDRNIQKALQEAYDEGVLMVAAAGNSGDGDALSNENGWPANSAETISVAAVSKKDNLPVASFSNSNDKIDYAGIGVNVRSFYPGGKYVDLDGTSMACPHVCGFLAALMTKGGKYEDQIKDDASARETLNENFAIDIGAKGRDNNTGLGFLTYLTKEEFEAGFLDLPEH